MNDKREFKLIKPKFYGKDDPNDPKKIDIEKAMEEARKRRENELANKKIIIDGIEIESKKNILERKYLT